MVSTAVRPAVDDRAFAGVDEEPPLRWSRPAEMFARSWETTPGRLSIIAWGLVIVIAMVGVAAAATAQTKSDSTFGLVELHEPTAADVQRLYRSLSDADVTAARAFLAAGDEPDRLRQRYEDDMAVAGPTLGLAAVDRVGDPRVAREIGIIGRQVPVYAGLVETARVNNGQGLPVGGAYLREASQLMRSEILPAVERLYRIQTERVADERSSATGFPFLATALALAVLMALIAAQTHIRRTSKRRLNVGLVVATVAIMIGMAWSAVALAFHASKVGAGDHDGTEQVGVLADARIAALRARADELLTLVARGDGGDHEERFNELARTVGGADGAGGLLRKARDAADGDVATHLDDAVKASGEWIAAHIAVRKLDDGGQYEDAVRLAIAEAEDAAEYDELTDDPASAPAFADLEVSLTQAINTSRQHFVDETIGGARALTGLAAGWGALAAIAACGVTIGIRRRLREYR